MAFTHGRFYAQKRAQTSTRRSCYAQTRLHEAVLTLGSFTHSSFYHREVFTQRSFAHGSLYTEKSLHSEAFTRRCIYRHRRVLHARGETLHMGNCTQRSFTQRNSCTRSLHRKSVDDVGDVREVGHVR